ncbi:MAG: gluconate 2-dehydrogenase subunit 3 family protein [Acidobacteriota bacterium]
MRELELTTTRRRVLGAAVARILPSDDGPGARETGVAEYIVGALAERMNRHNIPLFERGLDFLEVLAQGRASREFCSCSPSQQDEILREAQEFPNNDARRFFAQLVLLSLEGFLCDPQHGGNQGHLGWRYLGLSPEGVQLGNCTKEPSWRT